MSNFKQSLKQLVGRCATRLSPRIEERYYRRNHDSPLMDLYDRRRCIFIHVPKCAGISIVQQLYGREIGHQEVYHIKDCYPYSFKRYYTFTIVRDPASRFRSAFNYLKEGGLNDLDKLRFKDLPGSCTEAESLALAMASPEVADRVLRVLHFRPQVSFLEDLDGQVTFKLIIPLHHIKDGLDLLYSETGIRLENKHANRSAGPDMPFSKEASSILKRVYAKDYALCELAEENFVSRLKAFNRSNREIRTRMS